MDSESEVKGSNRTLVAAMSGLLLIALGIWAIPQFFAALASSPQHSVDVEERTLKLILTGLFSIASLGGVYLTWRSFFVVVRLSRNTLRVTRWPLEQKRFSLLNLMSVNDRAQDRNDGKLHLHYLELQFTGDQSIRIYTQSKSTQRLVLELAKHVDQTQFAPVFRILFEKYRNFFADVLKSDLILEQKIDHSIQEQKQRFLDSESNLSATTVRSEALRRLRWPVPVFVLCFLLLKQRDWQWLNTFKHPAGMVPFVLANLLVRIAPFGMIISIVPIGLSGLELLTGKSWVILSEKWNALRKWQRGIIVLLVAFASYIAFFFFFLAGQ